MKSIEIDNCEIFFIYMKIINRNPGKYIYINTFREKNREFKQALRRIHQLSDCRNLPLQSFIMLPIQRVTRIPLMMNTLLDTMGDSDDNSLRVKAAYTASKKVGSMM